MRYLNGYKKYCLIIYPEDNNIILQCNDLSLANSFKEFLCKSDINAELLSAPVQSEFFSEFFFKLTKSAGLDIGEIKSLIKGYLSKCDSKEKIHHVCTLTLVDDPQFINPDAKNRIAYFW